MRKSYWLPILAILTLAGTYFCATLLSQQSFAQLPQSRQQYADPSQPFPYKYEAVAASATAQVLGGVGAVGDYLGICTIYPATTTPGLVTVFDGTNTAANSIILFPGGTTTVLPISIPISAVSVNGAWKVTTGVSVSVVCSGRFT